MVILDSDDIIVIVSKNDGRIQTENCGCDAYFYSTEAEDKMKNLPGRKTNIIKVTEFQIALQSS